jgi:hypothetical protein
VQKLFQPNPELANLDQDMAPMSQQEAKRAILIRWHNLPPAHRMSEEKMAAFILRVMEEVSFTGTGDRYPVIKGWILSYLAHS